MNKKMFSLFLAVVLLGSNKLAFSEPAARELWYDKELETKSKRNKGDEVKPPQDADMMGGQSDEKALAEQRKQEKMRVKEERKNQKMKEKLEKKKMKGSVSKEGMEGMSEASKKVEKPKKAHKKKEKAAPHQKKEKKQKVQKVKVHKPQVHKEPKVKKESAWIVEKRARLRTEKQDRIALMAQWQELVQQDHDKDYAEGRYADLYNHPTWPTWAHFFKNKNYFNVSGYYQHADDAYNSCGENKDVSILWCGDCPITVKDVLLVSKLLQPADVVTVPKDRKIVSADLNITDNQDASKYLQYLGDQEIKLNSTVEQYGLDLDFAHYIRGHDIAIGIHVPIIYCKHRVHASMDINDQTILDLLQNIVREGIGNSVIAGGNPGDVQVSCPIPNAFARRYGASTSLFIKDIIKSKDFDKLGGSVSGLGDISLYLSGQMSSVYFDKGIFGIRVKLPTGKEESPWRLCSPALGTGLTEVSANLAFLTSYDRHFNPHIFIEGSFGLPGHVEKRVPREIVVTDDEAAEGKKLNYFQPDLTFANRVKTRVANGGFTEFDTTILGWGDYVKRIRVTRGFEAKVIFGNIIEKFIARRGSLDLYYQLTVKGRDRVSTGNKKLPLPAGVTNWDTDLLEKNTHRIGHDLGWEYTYQYDYYTRASVGMRYTVAGQNVPKLFDVHISAHHSF